MKRGRYKIIHRQFKNTACKKDVIELRDPDEKLCEWVSQPTGEDITRIEKEKHKHNIPLVILDGLNEIRDRLNVLEKLMKEYMDNNWDKDYIQKNENRKRKVVKNVTELESVPNV